MTMARRLRNRSFLLATTGLLLLLLSEKCWAVQTSKFQILIPQSLNKPNGGYDHRDALFGIPPYGGSIQQQVLYADSTMCDESVTYDDNTKRGWYPHQANGELLTGTPYILLLNRGECSFVQKVRNGQRAGASAVLIADDLCQCNRTDCVVPDGAYCETTEPLMADDGSGSDITIPSFLLFKEDADALIDVLKQQNLHVRGQMSFKVPAPDARVEYELWTSPSDVLTRPIEATFGMAAQALGHHASFTPHLYIYDGLSAGCRNAETGENDCFTLCTNQGLYCSIDPDDDLEGPGPTGADVVVEALRRICIWNQYGKADGIGQEWWKYVREFVTHCDNDTPDHLHRSNNFTNLFNSQACIDSAMATAGIDVAAIERCMQDSGEVSATSNATNFWLDKELRDQAQSGVFLVPALLVNDAVVRGSLSFATMLKAICSGFSTGSQPDICKECQLCANATLCVERGGSCPTGSGGGSGTDGVPLQAFAAAVIGLTVLFVCLTVLQYQRQQRFMRDQVRGIVQEYMPVTSQANRPDTSAALSDDDDDNEGGTTATIT